MSTIILIGIAFIIIYGIYIYNSFVRTENLVKNAFHNIDVMLKKRYDLIPQLVNSVKGIMKHEKETLESLVALRSQATEKTTNRDEEVAINNEISKKLEQIQIAVEAYPELKSNENMLQLQETLVDVEDNLSASRRSYNANVARYNTLLKSFPSNIIGNMFSYKEKTGFQATSAERMRPETTI